MAINFELRSVSKSKTAKANLYIRVREGGVSFRFRSPIEVSVYEYGTARERPEWLLMRTTPLLRA